MEKSLRRADEVAPIVSVCTICYNQAAYVEETIRGVLEQELDHPFELIIGDDGSTDGTREVCEQWAERYPTVIRLLPRCENLGAMRNFFRVLNEARGTYVAFCEGDDYWCDRKKLQKQVNFLEANPECGLVYTDVDFRHEPEERIEPKVIGSGRIRRSGSFAEHLANAGYIAPCTWLFRREHLPTAPYPYVDATFALALDIWAVSEVGFLPEVTAVYRVLGESASHTRDLQKRYRVQRGIFKIQCDYQAKYPHRIPASTKATLLKRAYRSLWRMAIVLGDSAMMEEICHYYLKRNPLQWLLLRLFPAPMRWLQRRKFLRRGFRVEQASQS